MDLYEHAVGLGGGPEAALGFVEGALREARPLTGPVYAAACRRVCNKQIGNELNEGTTCPAPHAGPVAACV